MNYANEFPIQIRIFVNLTINFSFLLLSFTFLKIKICKFDCVFLRSFDIYSFIFIKKSLSHSYFWFDFILYIIPPIYFTKQFFFRLNIIFLIIKINSSKWGHNFLLQHESREMSKVVGAAVVMQIRPCWLAIHLHPNLVATFQVQRRLQSQRTPNKSDVVWIFNPTRPDSTPVQINSNS